MDALALGPLLISLPRLYALTAALVLLVLSLVLLGLPRRAHTRWFNGLLLSWLVAARLGHVLTHLDSFATAPLDALKFWQPGYLGLAGLAAASVWTAWMLRDHMGRMLGGLALLLGCSVLWLALVGWNPLGSSATLQRLPELTLENLDGEPIALESLSGQPVLINLWATWCPPCLREMPLLAEVASRDDITVVAANQGEELLQVVRYLDDNNLSFDQALLDPQQRLGVIAESPGLPTSLYFDADGRLIERHVGELTRAQLDAWTTR
ncbi:TlpA disulfide reductase family protein [Halomonas sp. I5-271120]|uniref:TlpA family protein disulfide reductase n=1 Tax=Halomonas sp. I5-271120 TaxID=3061632 RepID=UPI00271558D1|nr:TlpA disulfide reductase family protein [Halomonas sp. I5-271120]